MKKSTCIIMLLTCPIVCFLLDFFSSFATLLCVLLSVIHFCVIGFLIDKKQIKWITAVLFSLLYPVSSVLAYTFGLLEHNKFPMDALWSFMVLAGVYEVVCGAMILINVAIRQKLRDEKLTKAMIIESVVLLAVFALAPLLTLQIDWPEFLDWYGAMVLYVMGWGIGMLSTFSFALGCMMKRRFRIFKLLAWGIGVVISVFLGLVFMEDECDPATVLNTTGILIWVTLTVIVMIPTLVGVLVQRKTVNKVNGENV